MSLTLLSRIETLEKQLGEEVQRRRILENWIALNFNFEVKVESEAAASEESKVESVLVNVCPDQKISISTSSPTYEEEDVEVTVPLKVESDRENRLDGEDPLAFSSSSIVVSEGRYTTEAASHSQSTSQLESNDDHDDEEDGYKKSKQRGRNRSLVWQYFNAVPTKNPSPSVQQSSKLTYGLDPYCKKCGKLSSPRANRMQNHVYKCMNIKLPRNPPQCKRNSTKIQPHSQTKNDPNSFCKNVKTKNKRITTPVLMETEEQENPSSTSSYSVSVPGISEALDTKPNISFEYEYPHPHGIFGENLDSL